MEDSGHSRQGKIKKNISKYIRSQDLSEKEWLNVDKGNGGKAVWTRR